MSTKEEILYHVVPSASGAGLMMSLGEHFIYSVVVGITVYFFTHVISFGVRAIINKIKCK